MFAQHICGNTEVVEYMGIVIQFVHAELYAKILLLSKLFRRS